MVNGPRAPARAQRWPASHSHRILGRKERDADPWFYPKHSSTMNGRECFRGWQTCCVGWLQCPLIPTSENCEHGIHPTVGANMRVKGHWKCSLTLVSDPDGPVLRRDPSLTPEEHTCTLVPGEVWLEPITSPGQWQEQLGQPRSGPAGAEADHYRYPWSREGQQGKFNALLSALGFPAWKTGAKTRGSQRVPCEETLFLPTSLFFPSLGQCSLGEQQW